MKQISKLLTPTHFNTFDKSVEMSDKELLELAAKACGKNGEYVNNAPIDGEYRTGIYDSLTERCWNPLTDDGNRYSLAKKLGFVIDFELHTVSVDITGFHHIFQWEGKIDEAHAFVLAAAEIGKTLG